jgi:hypothetical protein
MPPFPPVADLVKKTGYVDILDASGDLKPSSFRARVQATGARDFGEDVADRNMLDNVARPPSSSAQSFRTATRSRASSVASKTVASKRTLQPAYAPPAVEYDSDEGAPSPVVATGDEALKKLGFRRRRSQKLKERSGVNGPATSKPTSQPRTYWSRQGSSKTSFVTEPAPSPQPMPAEDTRVASRRASMSTLPSMTSKARPKPRPLTLSLYPKSKKTAARGQEEDPLDDVASPPSVPRYRNTAKKSSSASRNKSAPAPPSISRNQKRASLSVPHVPSLNSNRNVETQQWDSSDDDASYFSSRSIPTSRNVSRPVSRGSLTSYHHASRELASPGSCISSDAERPRPRTKSLGGTSIPRHPQLYDISEHIPPRFSSLDPNSSSATTPTTVVFDHFNHSSFARPQSQQTANTSIDHSGKSTSASDTSPSLNDRPPSSAYFTATEEGGRNTRDSYGVPGRREPVVYQHDGYDYPSEDSDVDSFVGPTFKKQDGEALLFRQRGYGNQGNDLPGLAEMMGGVDEDEADWEKQLSVPTNKDWYVGTRLRSPDANKRLAMAMMDSESDADADAASSVDETQFVSDVGEEQAKAVRHISLSAMGGLLPKLITNALQDDDDDDDDFFSDDDGATPRVTGDEWMDVARTMKLRKELRRQQLRERSRSQSRGRVRA